MKLVALCGAAGAGKDTVADMLPARKLAFADTLYREVAEAWGVTVGRLQIRALKETEQECFSVENCKDDIFVDDFFECISSSIETPRSPRQILQWWGDYRRAQDPDYFVKLTRKELVGWDWATPGSGFVIADVRFLNEAAMVRQLGGQIWQIKRPGYEAGGTGHASDTAGDEFGPDRVVVNDGTRTQLHSRVLDLWEMT